MARRLQLTHYPSEGLWLAYAFRGGKQLAPAELPQGIQAPDKAAAVSEAKRRLRKYAGWRFLALLRVDVREAGQGMTGLLDTMELLRLKGINGPFVAVNHDVEAVAQHIGVHPYVCWGCQRGGCVPGEPCKKKHGVE